MDAFLFITRAGRSEIARSLAEGGRRVLLCVPSRAVGEAADRSVGAVLVDGEGEVAEDCALIADLKKARVDVPVLYLDGSGSNLTAGRALEAGARECVPKPVNIFELRTALERLCRLRRDSRESRERYVAPRRRRNSFRHRARSDMAPGLVRALTFMEVRLREELTLEGLAREAGMSKFHFSRRFREETGQSPISYLIRLRIEKAKTLMRRSGMNVSAVADAVGYNDLSNFSKKFKEISGVSPSAYIASHRKKRI